MATDYPHFDSEYPHTVFEYSRENGSDAEAER